MSRRYSTHTYGPPPAKQTPLQEGPPTGEMTLWMIPTATLRAIQAEAAKRGMTAAQLIGKAVDEFLVNHPPIEGGE